MGSDLYMEEQSWRSRGYKGEWDGDELVIFADRFYHGWTEIWRGVPVPDNESLIKVMIGKTPPKPKRPISPYKVIERVLGNVVDKRTWRTADANEIWQAFIEAGFKEKQ